MKNLKKAFITLIIVLASFFLAAPTTSVFADNADTATETTEANDSEETSNTSNASFFDGRTGNGCQGFLGLISWDCNVNITNEDSLKNGIWQIAANVATDITVIAAYLVIGYVIYGGYLYMFSDGDPNKVATGKKAIVQAFIGLAIVMSAHVILAAIRVALVGNNGNFSNLTQCANETANCVLPNDIIVNALRWIIGISGAVAVIFVVYGGITYATSSGDPSKLSKAKQTILYALIGLAIVALAEILTEFVSNIIREANKNAYINQTTITKELSHEIKTT